MKEFKELIHATLVMVGYLFGLLIWAMAILALVAVLISFPIFAVAAVYKIICLICHMAFKWEIPILIGIGAMVVFSLTGLDQMGD